MVAYFIADQQEVTDPETMKTYSAGVAATIEQYGGKFAVRGGDPEVLLKAWYNSPEYADFLKMRLASSRSNAIIVDGT